MMEEYGSTDRLRRYLLGDLEEDQREQIEAGLLTDQKLQDVLSDVRDEIIDDYAFNALSERDRQLFDSNFTLDSERLDKLRLSAALAHYTETKLGRTVSVQPPASLNLTQRILIQLREQRLVTALVSALVILAIGYGSWRAYESYQLRKHAQELQAKQRQVEQYLAKLNEQDLSAYGNATLSLTLHTLLRESKATNKVRISANTEFLELKLEANESRFPTYRADIVNSEGVRLYSVENLKARENNGTVVVFLHLPGQLLLAGTYEIQLQGVSAPQPPVDIGRYPFQIVFM